MGKYWKIALLAVISIIVIIIWAYKDNNYIEGEKQNYEYYYIEEEKQNYGYYYKKVLDEESEITFSKTLEKNDFRFKNSEEIDSIEIIERLYTWYWDIINFCSQVDWCREKLGWKIDFCKQRNWCKKEWYWYIIEFFKLWNDEYELVWDLKNKDYSRSYLFKNWELIFEDDVDISWSTYSRDFFWVDWKLLFVYKSGKNKNEEIESSYNIFYDWESLNKKYGYESIESFFIYKWIIWFIVNKNKLFFNEKILPIDFYKIQNKSCCTLPSLFKVFENGALILADNIEWEMYKYEIIEIDLDDFYQ